MADLTNEEIAELRRLHEEGTPVPWCGDWDIVNEDGESIAETGVASADEDGPLIIAARNALPRLLDEVERLRARVAVLERVREAAEEMRGDPVVFWLGDERKDLLLRALDAAKEAQ